MPVALRSAWFLLCLFYLFSFTISHHSPFAKPCMPSSLPSKQHVAQSSVNALFPLFATLQTYLAVCKCYNNSAVHFFFISTASRLWVGWHLCHAQQQQQHQQICICQSVCFQNVFCFPKTFFPSLPLFNATASPKLKPFSMPFFFSNVSLGSLMTVKHGVSEC